MFDYIFQLLLIALLCFLSIATNNNSLSQNFCLIDKNFYLMILVALNGASQDLFQKDLK